MELPVNKLRRCDDQKGLDPLLLLLDRAGDDKRRADDLITPLSGDRGLTALGAPDFAMSLSLLSDPARGDNGGPFSDVVDRYCVPTLTVPNCESLPRDSTKQCKACWIAGLVSIRASSAFLISS